MADVADFNRRPVAIGDDHVVPRLRRRQLIVVVDGERLLLAHDRAFWAIDGRNADLRPHILELEVLLHELRRINLDADRRGLLAADSDQRHARDLTDTLGENVLRRIVDLNDRRYVRAHGQDQDRRIGGIDLAIGRWAGEILGQLPPGGVDRRLNVVRRSVDVPVEIELDGDAGCAERTR